MQFLIRDGPLLARLAFPQNRRFVLARRGEVPVQAVVGSVGRAIVEPAKERRIGLVQCPGERLFPQQLLTRMTCPEAFEIALGLIAQRLIGRHAGDIGLLDEIRRWCKDAVLVQNGFNVAKADVLWLYNSYDNEENLAMVFLDCTLYIAT